MSVDEDSLIERNVDYFVTESTIRKNTDPSKLTDFLKARKRTAHVCTRIMQGGTASIIVTEKTKITQKQSDEIRKILGMS